MIRLPMRRNPARCNVSRRLFTVILGAMLLIAAAWTTTSQAADEKKPHRVAVQVDVNDPDIMNLALNNIGNIATYYSDKGEKVEIELVAYGPGLHMLRDDTSPVKARLKSIGESLPNVTFSACENTRQGMKKKEGKDIPLVSQAKVVPAGVVRLMELQEDGWSYIRRKQYIRGAPGFFLLRGEPRCRFCVGTSVCPPLRDRPNARNRKA